MVNRLAVNTDINRVSYLVNATKVEAVKVVCRSVQEFMCIVDLSYLLNKFLSKPLKSTLAFFY